MPCAFRYLENERLGDPKQNPLLEAQGDTEILPNRPELATADAFACVEIDEVVPGTLIKKRWMPGLSADLSDDKE